MAKDLDYYKKFAGNHNNYYKLIKHLNYMELDELRKARYVFQDYPKQLAKKFDKFSPKGLAEHLDAHPEEKDFVLDYVCSNNCSKEYCSEFGQHRKSIAQRSPKCTTTKPRSNNDRKIGSSDDEAHYSENQNNGLGPMNF